MSKRRAYRGVDVKNVCLKKMLAEAPEGAVTAGIDIGKHVLFVVLRWSNGSFERPWKVVSPTEITRLTQIFTELSKACPLTIAMESTGTYGEPLRQALTDAKLDVQRVSGKSTHDYAEIFDGVPSQHDGKDAAIVSELSAIGKSWPWPHQVKNDEDAQMSYLVDWIDAQQRIKLLWIGRLESLLARHWPEATSLLDLTSATLIQALAHYGGPTKLAADADAATQLRRWGGAYLTTEKIAKLLQAAKQTPGVRQNECDIERMRQYATMALTACRQIQAARNKLKHLAANNKAITRQAKAVGTVTACVLWAAIGDPKKYHCGEAYRKAMGLNLKERSSGKHQGKLKITKRGPSITRRWLYFAAMRLTKDPDVRLWYQAKKAKDGGRAKGALIGIARKLAIALYVVGVRDEPFEAWRLFPGRTLLRKSLPAQSVATTSTEDVNRSFLNEEETMLIHQGALPPDPRDLSPCCQSRR